MTLTDTRTPSVATAPDSRATPPASGLRWFAALTGLTSLAILLQAVLAGAFVDKEGEDGLITTHGVVADISWGLALITTLVGWRVLKGRERPLLVWTAALFVLTLGQTGIGHLITDGGHDGLIALHVPLAMVIFGLYSVLSLKRPAIHGLSFVAFTFGCGAACLTPVVVWESLTRPIMQFNTNNLLMLFYIAVFPSTLAYLCFNRGVQLIGANRAAPIFHVVPVFGLVMAIVFLGERPQLFHIVGFALVLTGVFVASRKQASADSANKR